jgi:hypothetical protein
VTFKALLFAHLLLLTGCPGVAQTTSRTARTDHFWAVLDEASRTSSNCESVASRLEQRLRALPDSALEEFAQEWATWWAGSYTWDLWGAAYLINGGSSDDGFEYFRGWLLTRGSARWRLASTNPDRAFEDVAPGTEAECEDIMATLPTVYAERFGRDAPRSSYGTPSGEPWTEENLGPRFPRLARRFGPSE